MASTLSHTLDTNVISAIVRAPSGPVAAKLRTTGTDRVCCSIVVAAELRFGVERRRAARLRATVEGVLERIGVLPLDAPADRAYATLRTALEAEGKLIGANDMLIAAHALGAGLTLVTDNVREFSRIDGLVIENWLDR